MTADFLEPAQAARLLQRGQALQSEALGIITDLALGSVLARSGHPVHVGSSALGLMVSRDIDFFVVCTELNAGLQFETMHSLTSHPRIKQLRWSNWSGHFAVPDLPDGHSWGARYHADAGAVWKLDIWYLLRGLAKPQLALVSAIKRRLTPQTQLAILWIKDIYQVLPAYGSEVRSVDIYDAVLNYGLRTPSEFDNYLAERGKPIRSVS